MINTHTVAQDPLLHISIRPLYGTVLFTRLVLPFISPKNKKYTNHFNQFFNVEKFRCFFLWWNSIFLWVFSFFLLYKFSFFSGWVKNFHDKYIKCFQTSVEMKSRGKRAQFFTSLWKQCKIWTCFRMLLLLLKWVPTMFQRWFLSKNHRETFFFNSAKNFWFYEMFQLIKSHFYFLVYQTILIFLIKNRSNKPV
jgi:hypothetical protein